MELSKVIFIVRTHTRACHNIALFNLLFGLHYGHIESIFRDCGSKTMTEVWINLFHNGIWVHVDDSPKI